MISSIASDIFKVTCIQLQSRASFETIVSVIYDSDSVNVRYIKHMLHIHIHNKQLTTLISF